jgi:hypothetical protein
MGIKWEIIDAEREVSTGKVLTVSYLVIATLDKYRFQKYGVVTLDEPKSIDAMVKFEDLTKETIQGWVKAKIGADEVAKIETKLITKVQDEKAKEEAKTKQNGLPW